MLDCETIIRAKMRDEILKKLNDAVDTINNELGGKMLATFVGGMVLSEYTYRTTVVIRANITVTEQEMDELSDQIEMLVKSDTIGGLRAIRVILDKAIKKLKN